MQDRNAFTSPEPSGADSHSDAPTVPEKIDNEQLNNFFSSLLIKKDGR